VILSQAVLFRFKQTAKAGLKIGRISGQFSGVGRLPNKRFLHGDITMPCLRLPPERRKRGVSPSSLIVFHSGFE